MVFEKIREIIASQLGKDEDEITLETNVKDDLDGKQFVIKNPNATTTCGCGSSFNV